MTGPTDPAGSASPVRREVRRYAPAVRDSPPLDADELEVRFGGVVAVDRVSTPSMPWIGA